MDPIRKHNLSPRINEVEAALAAAFGPTASANPSRVPGNLAENSVLRVIERITGEAPRVLLRDEVSEHALSPVIDLSSSEKRSVPQGRGSYQILGEIAHGGMGVVMKGHDTDLGRDVALKVLHKELARRPEVVQRFVEEAQIGGQLQHPGIVPVYELGLMADERPYFTMKLVKGRTLAVLLAERKGASEERRKLLDVFESVCQTLAYAHSRGVIHRDLKPANVMVGAFGEVQVVDWGLAKVLASGGTADEKRQKQSQISIIETVRSEGSGSGSHSLVGSVMGTPAYMSPEQARGEIDKVDERSDVFSLGAILCEILTGAPPYLGESEKTIALAANAKLGGATKRLESCDADQDLIALAKECLAPAQQARPRNARMLAERIHEYLTSVEERAKQAQVDAAEARVMAREERKARRLTLSLAASLLITMLVAGGGWAWMSSQRSHREHESETQVNAALNEANLRRGEGKWAEALALIERAHGLADSDAAGDALRARVASDLAAIQRDTKLANAKAALSADNAALLAELADVRQPEEEGNTRYYSHYYLTDWAKLDVDHAAIFARHGLPLDDQTVLEAGDALEDRGIPVELAAALDEWAVVRSGAENKSGATQLANLARRIDADPTRNKLRDAMFASDASALKAFAAHEDLAQLPTTTLNLLGAALMKSGAEGEALAVYRRAQLLHPGDFRLAMNLGRALMSNSPPAPEAAVRSYTAALALRPNSLEAIHELARILSDPLKESARAIELFRLAIAQHPEDLHLAGHLAFELGDFDGALAAYLRAFALDPTNGQAQSNVGFALGKKGEFAAAVDAYRNAVILDPKSAYLKNALGLGLEDVRDYDGAIAAYTSAIELDSKYVYAPYNLGRMHYRKGNYNLAIAAYEQALALDPNYAPAHLNRGFTLYAKGDHDGAIKEYQLALEINPKYAVAHYDLGRALADKGGVDSAIMEYERALDADPKYVPAYVELAKALRTKGELERALALSDKAIELLDKTIELDPRDIDALSTRGDLLLQKQDRQGAAASFRRVILLDPTAAEPHASLALALSYTGAFDETVAEDRAALALDPKIDIYINFSYDLASSLDLNGAEIAGRHAIEQHPQDPRAHLALANALSREGDIDGAIAACTRAVQVDPKFPLAYAMLCNALENKGNLDQAITTGRRAIDVDPQSADGYAALTSVLVSAGDFDGAIEVCTQSIERFSRDARGYATLANVRQAQGDVEGAIPDYAHASALDPTLAASYLSWGNQWYAQGLSKPAIFCYTIAAGLDPHDASAPHNLGMLLYARGDLDGAIPMYMKALECDPKDLYAATALAWHLATRPDKARRDCVDALRFAQIAVALDEQDPNNFNNLGAALCCIGDWAHAIEALDHSLVLIASDSASNQHVMAADYCFLAIARAHLGELDVAREQLGKASSWHASHPNDDKAAELAPLLDEARAAIEAGANH